MEQIFAGVIVAAALLAALALGWRQWKLWHWLRVQEPALSPEDRSYYRWSLGRRTVGCVFLVLLAGMIYGLYALDIVAGLEELHLLGQQQRGADWKLTEQQQAFFLNSWYYVLILLLLLMLLFFLAGWDIQAIRRFGLRHRQRIRDDRRAMLERQLPILYAERRAKKQRDIPPEAAPPDKP